MSKYAILIILFVLFLITFVYSALPVALVAKVAASQALSGAGSQQQQQQVEQALAAIGQAIVAIESAYAQVRLMQLSNYLQNVQQHYGTRKLILDLGNTMRTLTITDMVSTIEMLRRTANEQMEQLLTMRKSWISSARHRSKLIKTLTKTLQSVQNLHEKLEQQRDMDRLYREQVKEKERLLQDDELEQDAEERAYKLREKAREKVKKIMKEEEKDMKEKLKRHQRTWKKWKEYSKEFIKKLYNAESDRRDREYDKIYRDLQRHIEDRKEADDRETREIERSKSTNELTKEHEDSNARRFDERRESIDLQHKRRIEKRELWEQELLQREIANEQRRVLKRVEQRISQVLDWLKMVDEKYKTQDLIRRLAEKQLKKYDDQITEAEKRRLFERLFKLKRRQSLRHAIDRVFDSQEEFAKRQRDLDRAIEQRKYDRLRIHNLAKRQRQLIERLMKKEEILKRELKKRKRELKNRIRKEDKYNRRELRDLINFRKTSSILKQNAKFVIEKLERDMRNEAAERLKDKLSKLTDQQTKLSTKLSSDVFKMLQELGVE
jgi:hypothetical protein